MSHIISWRSICKKNITEKIIWVYIRHLRELYVKNRKITCYLVLQQLENPNWYL